MNPNSDFRNLPLGPKPVPRMHSQHLFGVQPRHLRGNKFVPPQVETRPRLTRQISKLLRETSESGMKARAIPWMIAALAALLVSACDESPEPGTLPGSPAPTPTDADLALGNQIAGAAVGQIAATSESSRLAFAGPAATTADSMQTGAALSELGGNAVANQQAFRERFGLETPTPDQLATWQSYDARLTAYSNKDADWPYLTAAAPNWEGTTWNGDPGAVEGTTVAVDFNRIPRGSLIYIPALDMCGSQRYRRHRALVGQR